jgi:hypothetical protein
MESLSRSDAVIPINYYLNMDVDNANDHGMRKSAEVLNGFFSRRTAIASAASLRKPLTSRKPSRNARNGLSPTALANACTVIGNATDRK